MKVVILAGGFGTRISEETYLKPKPMIDIGNKPILWHLMKYYSHWGFNDFIILTGYKHDYINDYFTNFLSKNYDFEVNLENNSINYISKINENWKVKVIFTGINSMTGGRLLRAKKYLKNEKNFFLTYGDGLSDINLNKLQNFHVKSKSIGTLTAVFPPERFGVVEIKKNKVISFKEKPSGHGSRINGGFFVFNTKIFDYLKNDKTILEKSPLENLAISGNLSAFKHDGFWFAMDSLRDKKYLEERWNKNQAPWKIW